MDEILTIKHWMKATKYVIIHFGMAMAKKVAYKSPLL